MPGFQELPMVGANAPDIDEEEDHLINEAYLVSSEECMARCGAVLEEEVEGLQSMLLGRVAEIERRVQGLKMEAASGFERNGSGHNGHSVEEINAEISQQREVEIHLTKLYECLSMAGQAQTAQTGLLQKALALRRNQENSMKARCPAQSEQPWISPAVSTGDVVAAAEAATAAYASMAAAALALFLGWFVVIRQAHVL